jgi:hypothetical protein
VSQGDAQTFNITPHPNYHVADVLINGISIGPVTGYTFTNVTQDSSITALFAIDTYMFTATTGENGSISPQGVIEVDHGSSFTFTIRPDENYQVKDVRVDGQSVGAITTYTLFDIKANHTIIAVFLADNQLPGDKIGVTVYEDAEDGTTNGWVIYDNKPQGAEITNVYDQERQSRVIQLSGSGRRNGYRLRNDDLSPWQNSTQFVIEWAMKYSEKFSIYVELETTAGRRYLLYTAVDNNKNQKREYVHYGLGSGLYDGQWHTVVRDLQVDLEKAQPSVTILEVNGFLVRSNGKIDDVKLKATK